MYKHDFKALEFNEMDLLQNIAIQGIREGLKTIRNIKVSFPPRINNGVVTGYLRAYLKTFCASSNYWFYCEDVKENQYLIYRHPEYACVFKVRKTNPIDMRNNRDGLYNRSENSKCYIEHQVDRYLNFKDNSLLKDALKDYKNKQILFFHLGWSLSQQEVDVIHLVILHTIGNQKDGLDWYDPLIYATAKGDQINEIVNDDLINTNDNTAKKANIIKPKRLDDDQRKQSV